MDWKRGKDRNRSTRSSGNSWICDEAKGDGRTGRFGLVTESKEWMSETVSDMGDAAFVEPPPALPWRRIMIKAIPPQASPNKAWSEPKGSRSVTGHDQRNDDVGATATIKAPKAPSTRSEGSTNCHLPASRQEKAKWAKIAGGNPSDRLRTNET